MKKTYTLSIILTLAILHSCSVKKPFYNSNQTAYSIEANSGLKNAKSVLYLIGDAGEPTIVGTDSTLSTLAESIKLTDPAKTGVIFLGDNIYHDGMHSKHHPERPLDEAKIKVQLDAVLNFGGQVAFIPGNHDWHKGHSDGLKYLKRQEKFIEKYLNEKVFYPSDGCPGPELIEFGEDIALIIIDTQWWLQKEGKPVGDRGGCDVKNDADFILAIREMLNDNRDKQIVVAGHHPLYSNGEHGGYFRLKDHLFPLTKLSKKAYIPLPGLGSIYPLYRKYIGNIQDIPHERYSALVGLLESEFEGYPNLVYTSGHDHNLQFVNKNGINHILSGGGSKATVVRKNNNIDFAASEQGFSRVIEYQNGEIWVEFITPASDSPTGKVLYSKKISNVPQPKPEINLDEPYTYSPKLTPHVAHADYAAGPLKEKLLGKLYRDSWTDTINVPVLNMDSIGGGLIALQKGGGMQTKSIRYEGADGIQYVSRSINKFPDRLLTKELKTTVIADIVKDGIAGSHPYAFVTVPPMAEAAKVYHTNPKIVTLPDHPRLGEFREEFKGMLVLFEERPAHNQEINPSFGNAKKVVSSFEVIDKIRETHDAKVDKYPMLRARLFDNFIADWDRHDDQWRWARFKKGDKITYKPIPRDRDQVYFKQDGLVPFLASRTWAQRRFQSFTPDVRDMGGQNMNAQWVDRAYLTNLDLDDWKAVADSLQNELTDQLIEKSVRLLPESAFENTGEYTIATLKERRNKLQEFAVRYYEILAENVDVVGTYEKEYYKIQYTQGNVRVRTYTRKKGDKVKDELHFDRTFISGETKEVRIYGIGGNDEFEIKGKGLDCSVLVRIIGGSDKDKYHLDYNADGLKKKLHIYEFRKNDFKDKELKEAKKLKLQIVQHEEDHFDYERNEFKYDSYLPLISAGYSQDDGLFLGGGFMTMKQGFKKFPYASKHQFLANIAATGAFQADYFGDFTDAVGKFDLTAELSAKAPNYRFSFYGLGNDQVSFDGDWRDFQMRVDEYKATIFLKKSSKYNRLRLQFGPSISYYSPEGNAAQEERFPTALNSVGLDDRLFAGGELRFVYENIDHRFNPTRGIHFGSNIKHFTSLSEDEVSLDNSFATFDSEFRLYFPLTFLPFKHTVALKTALAHNLNETPFYFSNFIGGIDEMRGFRRNRLGGQTSFYNNFDFRFKLFRFKNHLIPMEVGMIAFTDIGRVWVEEESSNAWYQNYGGGLYVNPLDMFIINVSYGYSELDEGLITAKAGFHF